MNTYVKAFLIAGVIIPIFLGRVCQLVEKYERVMIRL